jgi:DNA-binding transcriptional regulator YiaG
MEVYGGSMTQTMQAVQLAQVRELLRSGRARAIRERANVSIRELADSLEVHEATVARWESGARSPRGPIALRYAELLRALAEVAP